MVLVDKIERICAGTFTVFIGWAVIAVAMSFAPFTHSLPYTTRVFVVLPISVVFGISAGLVISYGLFMIFGARPIPHSITFAYGGK